MEQFVRSVAETADKLARIEILVYVDEDDPERFEYLVTHKSLSGDSRVVNLFNFETLIDEPMIFIVCGLMTGATRKQFVHFQY
jgi:hypothetical protein